MCEKADIEVVTSIEALEGWRFFIPLTVKSESEAYLGSVVRHVIWPKREKLTSRCIAHGNKVGEDFCIESTLKHSMYMQLALPARQYSNDIQYHPEIRTSVRNEVSAESIPAFAGHCGIYGCKTYSELLRQASFSGVLFGKSYFWGKTILSDFGYRAQYAYPKTLEGGVCASCRHVLVLKDIVLYFESKSARSRYQGNIRKYQIYCSRCYFSKERNRSNRANRILYFEKIRNDYSVTIEENFIRG